MLKRTKYSPLRNDSLTSLEDCPERLLASKRDLCLDSDFAQLDPGTPSPHGSSTLRNFVPRVASIRLQSPNCLRRVLKGQANTIRTASKRDDRADWSSSFGGSFSSGPDPIHPALLSTRRPITLHRMASLPCAPCSQQSDGLCRLKTVDDCVVMRTSNKAVHHHYMGSVEVVQSMRTLDFDTRMQVTRYDNTLVAKIANTYKYKFKDPSNLEALILILPTSSSAAYHSTEIEIIDMQFSGSRAILTVSTDSLSLITASNLQRIVNHPMQGISFASGGDPVECHIMECPQGRASEIISTIGQAFETRFRQLLSQTSTLLSPRSVVRICPKRSPTETSVEQKTKQKEEVTKQLDYYNVITGKNFFSLDGGKEGKQVSKEAKKQEPDIQEVCLSRPVSLHENYSVREETSAPSADSVQCDDSGEQHSLLLDTPGQSLIYQEVRTRDQVFQSVGHLVRFHMEKQTPIFSGSSKLRLKQPILQSQ
ncbi:hypothetical protein CCH79_00004904 [Gambusia affinis]|uniref:PID domain-containing protein n=1 Tax=Gambusia affinis TaxID=33528 RepID=A0A315VIP2_GAMAF|nr:hypothetical protein CCH79_00004904 [Gambusia affinis]